MCHSRIVISLRPYIVSTLDTYDMDNEGARLGLEPGAETVYGTHEDSAMVMSEKVALHNSI